MNNREPIMKLYLFTSGGCVFIRDILHLYCIRGMASKVKYTCDDYSTYFKNTAILDKMIEETIHQCLPAPDDIVMNRWRYYLFWLLYYDNLRADDHLDISEFPESMMFDYRA